MTSNAWRTCLAALFALALAGEARSDDESQISIRTLSTHADRVSGGDVLVEVSLARTPKHGSALISLNGRDVTSSFRETAPNTLVGLVKGLALGYNRLTAEARGLGTESIALVNYPITGPIVSGPHEPVGPQKRPFICQTETFTLPDGSKLGPALDTDCSAATKITYVYLPAGATTFKPLPSTTSIPPDVEMIPTGAGPIPYVVRVETGTVNRGIDQIAVLHDPTKEAQPTPFAPPKAWNHKLIAVQGFGCPAGWYI